MRSLACAHAHRANDSVIPHAFDLIEPNGEDLRPDPLEGRKATLAMMLAKAGPRIRLNEHMEGDGATVFRHACKLGLEGIVSKRKDSAYRSGRSPDWLKMKNANAPAVKREEDWARRNGDKLSLPFCVPHRCVRCRRRESHRAPGRRREPSSCEGNLIWPHVSDGPGTPITSRQGRRVIEDSRRTRLV
jgi:hypothetical protein